MDTNIDAEKTEIVRAKYVVGADGKQGPSFHLSEIIMTIERRAFVGTQILRYNDGWGSDRWVLTRRLLP